MDYIKTKDDFSMFKYDGVQAMRIGRLDYAIECFERALAIQDDSETHRFYAQALISSNDLEGAEEELELVRKAEPENLDNLIGLADLYFQTESYEKVNEICNEALNIDASLCMPHYILAKSCFAQKDFINAIAQVTMSISAKDDFYDAYTLRCRILCAMQQYAEAEKDIDIVLENTEEDDETLLLKAEICDSLNKANEAEELYKKVIEYNPFVPDAYLKLGALMMRQGRKKEAEELAKEAMEYAPQAMDDINGEFTNWEQKMKESYSAIDPFGLN